MTYDYSWIENHPSACLVSDSILTDVGRVCKVCQKHDYKNRTLGNHDCKVVFYDRDGNQHGQCVCYDKEFHLYIRER